MTEDLSAEFSLPRIVAGTPTDMAPFATRMAWDAGHDAGLQWDEARDVDRVVVSWKKETPRPESVRLEYWKGQWPEKRVPKGLVSGGGFPGWMPEDDWFNGKWVEADAVLADGGSRWVFTFNPLNAREFTSLPDFPVRYRRTLRMRLRVEGKLPAISSWEAYTDSTWTLRDIRIEHAASTPADNDSEYPTVTVYNGHLQRMSLLPGAKPGKKHRGKDRGNRRSARCLVWSTRNDDPTTRDGTVVTVRTGADAFSFAANDLGAGPLFIKDLGALVTEKGQTGTLKQAMRAKPARKTYYDGIFDEPEQTLPRAWADMPAKRSFHFILGLEGRRQRFGVDPNGDVFRSHERQWLHKMPGRDTERIKGEPDALRWSFGFPQEPPTQRLPMRGYLPVMTTAWEADGLRFSQKTFAVLVNGSASAEPIRGDDTVAAIVLVDIENTSAETKRAELTLRVSTHEKSETLALGPGGTVRNREGQLRCIIEKRRGSLAKRHGGVRFEVDLKPSKVATVSFKLPYFGLTDDELRQLQAVNPAAALLGVAEFWEDRIAQSTAIQTPEPLINDFYKAHVTHLLINHERHTSSPGADGRAFDIARVGSFRYGAYTNESVMQLFDLDRRGFAQEAANGYELFLNFQGTVPLPGDFTTCDGVFYGAGGAEHGNYNQNHGWALWGLAEHYFLTGDRDWLDRVAGNLVKACDWIITQRSRTKRTDEKGARVVEFGFLPAGVLEDIQDYWYWLSTNVYTWWGMDRAAEALNDIGHPEGKRLVREAASFRDDLVAGFTRALERSAVVRLQDGTAVPHFPSHQHLRGRSYGWIRETLEGAIHLLRCGLIAPDSKMGTWVMKDYEDNLYLSEQFGYSGASIPDRERNWFSRGGFSQQPNLLCGPLPYLYRGEIKHFLRAYFNAFAAGFHADTRMITEHPLPHLGDWAGDHYKSSDESQSAYWLRLMFVYENGDNLYLGYALPGYWLKPGNTAAIARACTYFGETSISYEVARTGNRITARIIPPVRRPPQGIHVRFRHPDGKHLRAVRVNGEACHDFDKEFVHLPALKDAVEVVATFGNARAKSAYSLTGS